MPVSQVLVAHRRPDGSVDYYSSITRDLSDRRVLEEQLLRAGLSTWSPACPTGHAGACRRKPSDAATLDGRQVAFCS